MGQNPPLLKHKFLQVPSARVIKALMHHQYGLNTPNKVYGAQHYTYAYKVQVMLRAVWRLGRCQGVIIPQKGHLAPKTGFPTLARTSSMIAYIRHQE